MKNFKNMLQGCEARLNWRRLHELCFRCQLRWALSQWALWLQPRGAQLQMRRKLKQSGTWGGFSCVLAWFYSSCFLHGLQCEDLPNWNQGCCKAFEMRSVQQQLADHYEYAAELGTRAEHVDETVDGLAVRLVAVEEDHQESTAVWEGALDCFTLWTDGAWWFRQVQQTESWPKISHAVARKRKLCGMVNQKPCWHNGPRDSCPWRIQRGWCWKWRGGATNRWRACQRSSTTRCWTAAGKHAIGPEYSFEWTKVLWSQQHSECNHYLAGCYFWTQSRRIDSECNHRNQECFSEVVEMAPKQRIWRACRKIQIVYSRHAAADQIENVLESLEECLLRQQFLREAFWKVVSWAEYRA